LPGANLPTYDAQRLGIKVVGAELASQGKSYVLTGPDEMAYNDPGKDPGVKFTEKALSGIRNTLEVGPASATIFEIPVK